MIKLTRVVVILLAIFSLILLSAPSASASDILFETVMPWYYWWSGMNWGGTSFTLVSQAAFTYRPSINQEVCIIKAGLYKSGNPIDNVVMTVRESADNGYPIGVRLLPQLHY